MPTLTRVEKLAEAWRPLCRHYGAACLLEDCSKCRFGRENASKMMALLPQPSCMDCQKATIYGGHPGSYDTPPEPEEVECDQMSKWSDDELELLTEDDFPAQCPAFLAHPAGNCVECKTPIETAAYLWQITVSGLLGNMPACSEKCRSAAQAKCDAEIAEMTNRP